jgi:hypothetical protein
MKSLAYSLKKLEAWREINKNRYYGFMSPSPVDPTWKASAVNENTTHFTKFGATAAHAAEKLVRELAGAPK